MHKYLHKVQYYETDQMRVVHHSNYLRWMEEARIACLDSLGVSCPVVSVDCRYCAMTRFGETVRVETALVEVGNVRYRLAYRMYDADSGQLRAEGESCHCFVDNAGRVLSLRRADPALFARFRAAVEPAPA